MENDNELMESFLQEITGLNMEILEVLKALNENVNQPQEFLKFSNIVDRIYGTAMTLGYEELGTYCGELKAVTRLAGNTEIQRSYKPILKLMMNYAQNFKSLKDSLTNPAALEDFKRDTAFDLKKMAKMHEEIFAFSDEAHAVIKSQDRQNSSG